MLTDSDERMYRYSVGLESLESLGPPDDPEGSFIVLDFPFDIQKALRQHPTMLVVFTTDDDVTLLQCRFVILWCRVLHG